MINLEKEVQKHAGKIRLGFAALGAMSGVGGAGVPDLQKAITESSKPAIVSMFEPSKAHAEGLVKPAIFKGEDGFP